MSHVALQFVPLCRGFRNFLGGVFRSRQLILDLTRRDFTANYLGSYLNFIWAFVQPFITIIVMYFVFQVGFRSMPTDGHPFILWLMAAMIPWFFFQEGLGSATTSILSYSYLVKKVVFRTAVIPLIKIASALFVHSFFIVLLLVMLVFHGYGLSIAYLQVFYYLFACLVLLIGLSWITSSVVIFVRDVSQVVNVLLQIGFWMTPIFWNYRTVPDHYKALIKLNPMLYIVEGYRGCLLYGTWFWEDPWGTLYFWTLAVLLFVVGAVIFFKLRPHFADVL